MLEQPIIAPAEFTGPVLDGRYIDLGSPEWGVDGSIATFVAVYENGRCLVAKDKARDPDLRAVLQRIEQKLGLSLRRVLASLDEIAEARRIGLAGRRGQSDAGMRSEILDLIEQAGEEGASDIHIDVGDDVTHIWFRIGANLHRRVTWTKEKGRRFLGAAYAMADIANGTYSPKKFLAASLRPRENDDWAFPDGIEAVRMQFNPPAFGTAHAVWRVLYFTGTAQSLDTLGFEPNQLKQLHGFARKDSGLAIIAGATNTGKSTTVVALIGKTKELDEAAGIVRSLFTIEDPPERRIPGAIQLAVHNTDDDSDRSTAFADGIRAALRSDPDQLFVGEVRDGITADLTITAAMTGHQVWTTLHCTTAHMIPMRLMDMGVERFKIFGSEELYIAVAQKLLPLLCPHCSIPADTAVETGKVTGSDVELFARMFGGSYRVTGAGCAKCKQMGTKGRTVLAEVVRTDAAYLAVLEQQGVAAARKFSIGRGELSIAMVGQIKARAGLISPLELMRKIEEDELAERELAVSVGLAA